MPRPAVHSMRHRAIGKMAVRETAFWQLGLSCRCWVKTSTMPQWSSRSSTGHAVACGLTWNGPPARKKSLLILWAVLTASNAPGAISCFQTREKPFLMAGSVHIWYPHHVTCTGLSKFDPLNLPGRHKQLCCNATSSILGSSMHTEHSSSLFIQPSHGQALFTYLLSGMYKV